MSVPAAGIVTGLALGLLIAMAVGDASADDYPIGPVDTAHGDREAHLLWPTGAPGAVGSEPVDKPKITVYRAPAAQANGAAVVVCPGGSYMVVASDHEGKQVAEWLNSFGVTAFVLQYRLGPRYRHPAPLQDAQRAIRMVRAGAKEWGIDSARVGILGFSAGGHLASTTGTHFDAGRVDATDAIERMGSRPDFMVLVYPVISFTADVTHRGSRESLLGPDPDPTLVGVPLQRAPGDGRDAAHVPCPHVRGRGRAAREQPPLLRGAPEGEGPRRDTHIHEGRARPRPRAEGLGAFGLAAPLCGLDGGDGVLAERRRLVIGALIGLLLTAPAAEPPVRSLHVTILSTMLADEGIGEWGFAALVEVDGRRILFDTGARPETVKQNARELKVDLDSVDDVILSHNHDDHVGGLLTLRRDVNARRPGALARAHVAPGIFWSRPQVVGRGGERSAQDPIGVRGSGRTIPRARRRPRPIFPGVWLTGPVPRVYPERNWSSDVGRVVSPAGPVDDTLPEDMSLVFDTPKGLVVLTGCGHAGIVNTVEHARKSVRAAPLYAVLGGFHLFRSTTSASTGRRASSASSASRTSSAPTAPGSRPSTGSATAPASHARPPSSAP